MNEDVIKRHMHIRTMASLGFSRKTISNELSISLRQVDNVVHGMETLSGTKRDRTASGIIKHRKFSVEASLFVALYYKAIGKNYNEQIYNSLDDVLFAYNNYLGYRDEIKLESEYKLSASECSELVNTLINGQAFISSCKKCNVMFYVANAQASFPFCPACYLDKQDKKMNKSLGKLQELPYR